MRTTPILVPVVTVLALGSGTRAIDAHRRVGLLRRLSSDQRIRPWRRRTRRTRRRSSRASIRSAAAATHTHRAALRWVAGPQSDCAATPRRVPREWQAMSKSRIAGSSESDNTAKCLPPGHAGHDEHGYGMEVMQTKDKITFFSELNDALRRVYLDGASQRRRSSTTRPTRAIHRSLGGDTLVVETVALRDNTYIEGFTPHSDQMTIRADSVRRAGDSRGSHHGERS